jgi:hypothetical protein
MLSEIINVCLSALVISVTGFIIAGMFLMLVYSNKGK